MNEKTFNIDGMSCQHCVKAVEKELSALDIDYYEVEIGLAKVKYSGDNCPTEKIEEAIEEAGFSVVK